MKSFKKLLAITLFITSTVALSSCGMIRNLFSGLLNGDSEPTEMSSYELTSHEAVSTLIGVDGGIIRDDEDNLKISIPQGALQADTNITAQYIDAPELISNNLSLDFLGGIEFGPSGTTFAEPITVDIKLNKAPSNNQLSVFCYYEAGDVWEYVTDAIVKDDMASFTVTHFSKYQVMDRTSDFLNEFQNIVKHGKVNGFSDSEIIEAFRDYLINNKHIMDYYIQFGGYWYEPCGLKLSGAYQIDNQRSDPNQMAISEGQSNKVGNKYGLCTVDGATSSKKKAENVSLNSEMFDVTVLVEYKIITPDIELSASKTKLNKGETANVSVRCHYTNPANFYPEFKDLDLVGYPLRIAKPTHFSVNKSSLITDGEGGGDFTVTALEKDKAETIIVSFNVSGDFGTHAEGHITFNSQGGYSFTGRIEETYSMTYEPNTMGLYTPEISQYGSVTITVTYDFSGTIKEEENGPVGKVNITNASISIENEQLLFIVDNNSNPYSYADNYWDMFKNKNPLVNYDTSIDCVVNEETDGSVSLLGTSFEDIAVQSGNVECIGYMVIPSEGYKRVTSEQDFEFEIKITTGSSVLLPFALIEGEETYTASSMLDEVNISFGGESIENYRGINFSDPVKSVEQTITVVPAINPDA